MNIEKKRLYIIEMNKLKKVYIKEEIESAIVKKFLENNNIDLQKVRKNNLMREILSRDVEITLDIKSIEDIEYLFEIVHTETTKNENGIVFTPKFIVENMIEVIINKEIENKKILDPACGSGAFLRGISNKIKKNTNMEFKKIIEENIYGIDIDSDNIRRTEIVLTLQGMIYGEFWENINLNLMQEDALKINIKETFGLEEGFDYILGNPPYVNAHDLSKEVVNYMKKNFKTTLTGGTNIFYAFIEKGMDELKENGELVYIVPNNFLTIKSSKKLREYIKDNGYLNKIIDFTENMIFKPVRTYNCIINLNKKEKDVFEYAIIKKTDSVKNELKKLKFIKSKQELLNNDGWNLLDEIERKNIEKIESYEEKIKPYIKTGIATLMDKVYLIEKFDKEAQSYYKIYNDKKYFIEEGILRTIYKGAEIKPDGDITVIGKKIIFPYEIKENNVKVLEEEKFKKKYPKAYQYLEDMKANLATRDGGKENKVAWYAYGRSQGLKNYGEKLLYPTFSDKPRFGFIDKLETLYYGGYAILGVDGNQLRLIQKILNSKVMEYYISKTSYSIAGGYMCYQKKYIEKFSIPNLNEQEKEYIIQSTKEESDKFLIEKYNLEV